MRRGICYGLSLPSDILSKNQAPNLQTLIPALKVQFHPLLTFALVGAPTIAFAVISVLFAYLKLKSPVLDLLRERQNVKVRIGRDGKKMFRS